MEKKAGEQRTIMEELEETVNDQQRCAALEVIKEEESDV